MTCVVCGKKPRDDYRINYVGDTFCNDACYENDMSDRSHGDTDDPYGETYASIRMDYLLWKDKWELDMNQYDIDFINQADELWETMQSFINDYIDFYMNEGDDGIFTYEIYQYVRKFEQLQADILAWRPDNRDTFYNIYFEFHEPYLKEEIMYSIDYSRAVLIFKDFIREHHPNRANELIQLLDCGYSEVDYIVPTEEYFVLIFSTHDEAEQAKSVFQDVFSDSEITYSSVEKAHFCDCGCGLYISVEWTCPTLAKDGWHFSDICGAEKLNDIQ